MHFVRAGRPPSKNTIWICFIQEYGAQTVQDFKRKVHIWENSTMLMCAYLTWNIKHVKLRCFHLMAIYILKKTAIMTFNVRAHTRTHGHSNGQQWHFFRMQRKSLHNRFVISTRVCRVWSCTVQGSGYWHLSLFLALYSFIMLYFLVVRLVVLPCGAATKEKNTLYNATHSLLLC